MTMVKYDRDMARALTEKRQGKRIEAQSSDELLKYKAMLEGTLQDVQQATDAQNAALENTIEVNKRMADLVVETLSEAKHNRLQRAKAKEKLDKFREEIGHGK